jgi:hypothetical protein
MLIMRVIILYEYNWVINMVISETTLFWQDIRRNIRYITIVLTNMQ